MQKIKQTVINIREIFWPLLEPNDDYNASQIKEEDYSWQEEDMDLIIEYANKYYESEETRKKDIESKSIIFIGTFGVTATILIYLSKDLVLNNSVQQSPFVLVLITLMTLCVIYLCRAIWFSIGALQRRSYYRIGFPRFLLEDNIDKRKKLIIEFYNHTQKNSQTINLKVDFMTMAQEYFKRVVILVGLFSILVLGKYLYSYKTVLIDLFSLLKDVDIGELLAVIILGAIAILYLLVLVILYKLSKIKPR